MKCRGATALLRNVYMNSDRPWMLEPTSDPTIPDAIDGHIKTLVSHEVMSMNASGEMVSQPDVISRIEHLYDAAKLAESASRFTGGHRTCVGYEELLRDPGVDAVYIPLPNSLHAEWTIRAMEHGKHVLCEKPMALNAAECRRMIDAAEKNNVRLMEAFMYRYTDRTRKVVETLRSGVLGEVKFVQASFRFLLANPASIKL
jgi:hypothetical protein